MGSENSIRVLKVMFKNIFGIMFYTLLSYQLYSQRRSYMNLNFIDILSFYGTISHIHRSIYALIKSLSITYSLRPIYELVLSSKLWRYPIKLIECIWMIYFYDANFDDVLVYFLIDISRRILADSLMIDWIGVSYLNQAIKNTLVTFGNTHPFLIPIFVAPAIVIFNFEWNIPVDLPLSEVSSISEFSDAAELNFIKIHPLRNTFVTMSRIDTMLEEQDIPFLIRWGIAYGLNIMENTISDFSRKGFRWATRLDHLSVEGIGIGSKTENAMMRKNLYWSLISTVIMILVFYSPAYQFKNILYLVSGFMSFSERLWFMKYLFRSGPVSRQMNEAEIESIITAHKNHLYLDDY